jgi:hypothetical protein
MSLFGEVLLRELLLELLHLVLEFVALAELLLNRPHLLVEVVLLLRALHLLLYARADLALDLEHLELGLKQRRHLLDAARRFENFEEVLALVNLQVELCGDGIGKSRDALDLGNRIQRLRRNLLVELYVLFKTFVERLDQGLPLGVDLFGLLDALHRARKKRFALLEAIDARPLLPLDQHLHGAVREAQHLDDRPDRPNVVHITFAGVVLPGLALGHEKELAFLGRRVFERGDRLCATHKERNHHVGEDHDVPQGEHRERSDSASDFGHRLRRFRFALEDPEGLGALLDDLLCDHAFFDVVA